MDDDDMSLSANVNEKAALIWAIADKLTGVYVIEGAMEKRISDKGSEQTIKNYGVSLED